MEEIVIFKETQFKAFPCRLAEVRLPQVARKGIYFPVKWA